MDGEMKVLARVVKDEPEKKINPEEREYLICTRGKDGAEDRWDIVLGRTDAYNYIKNCIEFIVLEESFILVETTQLKSRKSIYAFMKYAENFYEDAFDIEDYVKGDYEEVETTYTQVDAMFNNVEDAYTGESMLMNSNIDSTDLGGEEE